MFVFKKRKKFNKDMYEKKYKKKHKRLKGIKKRTASKFLIAVYSIFIYYLYMFMNKVLCHTSLDRHSKP